MEDFRDVFDFIDGNRDLYLSWLYDACRIPSVSAQNTGIGEMAGFLEGFFRERLGTEAEILQSGGYPFVTAGVEGDVPRTILFYNHYDVQPVDPIDEWESDPFEPVERDGRIYARGAADNKGSMFARLCAVHAWRGTRGSLPLGVKFFYEGEEEIGSPNLGIATEKYPSKISCDAMLWEGGSRDIGGALHVALGVKGLAYFELRLRTANQDQHSSLAPIIPNAAWRMVRALSTIKDEDDKILIDGFYDDVRETGPEDKFFLNNMTFQEEDTKKFAGIDGFLGGVSGYELKERLLYWPTANIAGFVSGYGGPGSKTILPAEAVVKMDFRLVPDMSGERVYDLLRRHLESRGFGDIEVEMLSTKPPYRTNPDDPFVRTVIDCARDVYGVYPAVYRNMAGTTGMYDFCTAVGAPAVLVGVFNEDSRLHAPNENIFVEDYILGIKMVAAVMGRYALQGRDSG
ncbi:MAG: M20/M25/M40 family metallo-hydrolase [Synergistaceae bacterium]|jgi:acetylornithine deacetylase/succinyl-diaminopimelate desuccinylase-like protein|nr:M20/M25/M40 family metallo-hydrolase [Synergistaceae bacterium]